MTTIPTQHGEADLFLGSMDGPAEYLFGQVSGIAEDATGRIFVSDGFQNEVRVFDQHGEFLFTIGREGRGPGEFRRPCCIAFGPDGRLWVRDNGNRRYVAFEVVGEEAVAVATRRMVHSDGALHLPLTFTTAGYLVDVGHHPDAGGRLSLTRFKLSEDGTVASSDIVDEPDPEELGTLVREIPVRGGMSRYYFPQPYGPRSLVTHGPGGTWATAVSSDYSISVHSAVGATTTTQDRPRRGPGRPRLGVVGREVTLLPRHWAWLEAQRGNASATLRQLVDQARREGEEADSVRRAQDAAHRFCNAMAGDRPGFEEAMRALFARDGGRFNAETYPWPCDIRDHARWLAEDVFGGVAVGIASP